MLISREQLIAELEEKQKMIEAERHNMELTGDSMEMKPITTRKLRRRANEPSGKWMGYSIMSQCHTNSKCILILLKAANEGKLEKMNNISKLADLLTLTNFLFPIYLYKILS